MTRRALQGFTLAELLVGLAVTSIVMLAIVAAVIGVQSSYQREAENAQVLERGRDAINFIERATQLAGYGIDPRLGIDLATPTGVASRDNFTVTGFTYPSRVSPTPVVVTDDLAVRYRDPAYLRRGTYNGSSVTLTSGTFGVDIPTGKLLMVACPGAQQAALVRTTAAPSGAAVTVSGAAASITPFPTNPTDACFTQTGVLAPYVMLVHEFRLRVINLGNRPWLVAFRNLSANVSSSTDYDPIAPDIETFQVAFGFNRPPTTGCCSSTAPLDNGSTDNKNWVMGDALSETTPSAPATPATASPKYTDSYDSAARYTSAPANIRQIYISLVVRSARPEPDGRRATGQRDVFNWDYTGTGANDGYQRQVLHTVIDAPNLASRSFFVPALRSGTTGTADNNTWGG